MTGLLRDRLTIVCVLLIAVTLVSAMIGGTHGWGAAGNGAAATVAVLGIAFAKVWLVMSNFMEVRAAPLALRVLVGGWLLVVCALLIAIYAGATGGAA